MKYIYFMFRGLKRVVYILPTGVLMSTEKFKAVDMWRDGADLHMIKEDGSEIVFHGVEIVYVPPESQEGVEVTQFDLKACPVRSDT